MPLIVADDYPFVSPDNVKHPPTKTVLIFYASIVDGKMWCRDCRDVEDLVKKTFESNNEWLGVIIYVGDRPTWRDSNNTFRKEWGLTGVPTLVTLNTNGKEERRLVEHEITPKSVWELLVVNAHL